MWAIILDYANENSMADIVNQLKFPTPLENLYFILEKYPDIKSFLAERYIKFKLEDEEYLKRKLANLEKQGFNITSTEEIEEDIQQPMFENQNNINQNIILAQPIQPRPSFFRRIINFFSGGGR